MFHLLRRCQQEELLGRDCLGIYTGKGLAQNCLSQSEGEGNEERGMRVEEQAVESKVPKWSPVVGM
jgi:hypothetical protein